jgi:hypothetical protein
MRNSPRRRRRAVSVPALGIIAAPTSERTVRGHAAWWADLPASRANVQRMYFIGAGVIIFVAILVVVAYFQQRKRRR